MTWMDPDGLTISPDDEMYSISQSTVDNSGKQLAELSITPAKLETLASTSAFKCSAQSGKFPASPSSPYQELVVTVLTIGNTHKFNPEVTLKLNHLCSKLNGSTYRIFEM